MSASCRTETQRVRLSPVTWGIAIFLATTVYASADDGDAPSTGVLFNNREDQALSYDCTRASQSLACHFVRTSIRKLATPEELANRVGTSHAAISHNVQGNTPLHAALAGRRELPVITALLAAGADASTIDAQGYAPLHLAAARGDQAVSELLLACGADRTVRTRDGKVAADFAREKDHTDLAAFLAVT